MAKAGPKSRTGSGDAPPGSEAVSSIHMTLAEGNPMAPLPRTRFIALVHIKSEFR